MSPYYGIYDKVCSRRRRSCSSIMIRILLQLLLLAEVVYVADHFLQAVDPLLGLLLWTGYEVQVLATALEHDGEAAALHLILSVLPQALWLTAHSDCWDVIQWNWGQRETLVLHSVVQWRKFICNHLLIFYVFSTCNLRPISLANKPTCCLQMSEVMLQAAV